METMQAEVANYESDARSMEERIRSAYADAVESLGVLSDKLKTVLRESDMPVDVKAMSNPRTALEGAVNDIETLGGMIRELTHKVVL